MLYIIIVSIENSQIAKKKNIPCNIYTGVIEVKAMPSSICMGLYLSINEPQPAIPSGSVKQLNYQEYGTYVTAYKVWLPVKHELLN